MAPRSVKGYPFYPHGGQDPIIKKIHQVILDMRISLADVSHMSGVSVMTLNNWFSGVTRNPQHKTVKAITMALQIDAGDPRMPQTLPDWTAIKTGVDDWYKNMIRNMEKGKPPTIKGPPRRR